ncbi:hypothetical protein [Winogradskyella poriferorum]|uniref:hypothetical protein n=1 Tax=Winogradskyella poriferorum TaxID=307627 RepID=UPI003D653F35
MKRLVIYFLVLYLFGCSSNIKDDKIDKIVIYNIGLGVLTPTPMTEESIRDIEAYEIRNLDSINLVKEYISKLKPSKYNQIVENIYMVSDFYYNNKKLYTLRFDKGSIEFDGNVFEKNDTLIEILYRNDIRFKRNYNNIKKDK